MAFITLTTDFGLSDWFVGTMKGVIARLAPNARVIDVTHDIPPGDIRAGAFALAAAYRFFPKGTVHVAVVDPGVGSGRKGIAVRTADYFFVGPDNGVLSWALARERVKKIHALENSTMFLHPVSRTFHGRDIFAPVAAHLSCGMPARQLGGILKDIQILPWLLPRPRGREIEGEVIYIDRFGNGITNLDAATLAQCKPRSCHVQAKRGCTYPVKEFYQAVPRLQPVAIAGSSGFLEISVNGGSAQQVLGLRIGTLVRLSSGK